MATPAETCWYKLDDNAASTVIVDSSATATNGALVGGDDTEDIDEAGKVGTCLHLDGSADYITAGSPAGHNTGVGTWMAWVKLDSATITTNPQIIHRVNATAGTVALMADTTTDKWRFNLRLEGSEATSRKVYSDDVVTTAWTHVCGTFDGTTQKIYVDAVLQADDDTTGGAIDEDGFVGTWIGRHGTVATSFADGCLDDVRIFAEALTIEQIQAIHNSGNGSSDSLADLMLSGHSQYYAQQEQAA